MKAAETEQIAVKWMSAFNAQDLERLLDLYHEDAEHYSPKLKVRHPETNGLVTGKPALRKWWRDAFDRLPTLQYQVTSLTANEDRVFMEYIRKLEGDEDLLVAEVLEARDGKIASSRVYHG